MQSNPATGKTLDNKARYQHFKNKKAALPFGESNQQKIKNVIKSL